jgi:hypothetical protein
MTTFVDVRVLQTGVFQRLTEQLDVYSSDLGELPILARLRRITKFLGPLSSRVSKAVDLGLHHSGSSILGLSAAYYKRCRAWQS